MPMLGYRLYFTNEKGSIEARIEFLAEEDREALTLAAFIFDACSDCYCGYEVWQERRQVLGGRTHSATKLPLTVGQLNARMQVHLLDIEEGLQRSRWRVAESRRLLESIDALKAALVRPCAKAASIELNFPLLYSVLVERTPSSSSLKRLLKSSARRS
jgi:hypothetical protein